MAVNQPAVARVMVKDLFYDVRLWSPGMEVLKGNFLSVDTETHMIVDPDIPDLVIAQVCNGRTVDIVSWVDCAEYFRLLDEANPTCKYVFHNAVFDLNVLNLPQFSNALENDRVVDVGVRYRIRFIRERGYASEVWNLDHICQDMLSIVLDKDDAIRCSFRRGMDMTMKHIQYAASDAIVTYLLNHIMEPEPHEYIDIRSSIVLDQISRNGMLVDKHRFYIAKKKAEKRYEDATFSMRAWGMDAGKDKRGVKDIKEALRVITNMPVIDDGVIVARTFFSAVMASVDGDWSYMLSYIATFQQFYSATKLKAAEKRTLESIYAKECAGVGLNEMIEDHKPLSLYKLAEQAITDKRAGMDGAQIRANLRKLFNEYGGWQEVGTLKPATQFESEMLFRIEDKFLIPQGAKLPRTAPTVGNPEGKIQFTKKELWMLDGFDIEDVCLQQFREYKNAQHDMVFYKDEYIYPDGRVRPHFNNMLVTYRTSSSKPNLQQLPRKGDVRSMYCAAPGYVLVAVDYAQIELCALAAHCLVTQGKSRLAELINADVDLHSWFIGRRKGIVTDANDYDGSPESVEFLKGVRKAMSKEDRDMGKACNYGFPGGMQGRRFLAECRSNGMLKLTIEEAEALRTLWFDSLPEIREFMKPVPVITKPGERQKYIAKNLLGRIRGPSSFNEICNFNFQSLTAGAAKVALWNLYKAGYRMVNFVHDEVIFELPEGQLTSEGTDSLDDSIREIERIMVSSMANIIKGVKVGTEATVMTHWSKSAKLKYNDQGMIVPWQPKEA